MSEATEGCFQYLTYLNDDGTIEVYEINQNYKFVLIDIIPSSLSHHETYRNNQSNDDDESYTEPEFCNWGTQIFY